jgi:hypothetical protein
VLRVLGRLGDFVKNHVYAFDFPLSGEAMDFARSGPAWCVRPRSMHSGSASAIPRETYVETIRWLHRAGHLTPAQAGKLAD